MQRSAAGEAAHIAETDEEEAFALRLRGSGLSVSVFYKGFLFKGP